MNWTLVSFDWNQAKAFLATAEEGSLSAAARALGLTQPTVGRQIAALEDSLGVVLFDRIGRSLALTPSGIELLDHVRSMGDAAGLVSLSASGQSQSVEGLVCITATDGMSTYVLPRVLAELREIAPQIDIEIVASNAVQDLRRREADIAIRHVRPEQPELIARLVRTFKGHLYASRDYLDRHGRPADASDLSHHTFVGFDDPDRAIAFLAAYGLPLTRSQFKLVTNSGIAGWEMVKQGLGIGVMMEDVARMTPQVECVLEDMLAVDVPIWLTTHRELHTSRRIRLVFDFLVEALS